MSFYAILFFSGWSRVVGLEIIICISNLFHLQEEIILLLYKQCKNLKIMYFNYYFLTLHALIIYSISKYARTSHSMVIILL